MRRVKTLMVLVGALAVVAVGATTVAQANRGGSPNRASKVCAAKGKRAVGQSRGRRRGVARGKKCAALKAADRRGDRRDRRADAADRRQDVVTPPSGAEEQQEAA